jgi:hypothetical protein
MAESKSDRFDMVVENENRRVGRMSKEELSQCVLDIKGFFERVGVKVTGASSGSFQSLGKAFDFDIPEAFSYFLESVNGNIWFMEKEAMTVDTIIDTLSELESSELWRAGLLPFCGDSSGMLVIDAKSGSGMVVEWDEDDGLGDTMSSNFLDFIEKFRDDLSKCEYVDGCGLIEKVGAPSRK